MNKQHTIKLGVCNYVFISMKKNTTRVVPHNIHTCHVPGSLVAQYIIRESFHLVQGTS